MTELIDTAAAKSDYYRKWASYELLRNRRTSFRQGEALRGIGISTAYQGNDFIFDHPGWGSAVVEIEINPVSVTPFIRGIWLVVDSGKIVSKDRASRVLRTGIIQALGWTCREKLNYKDGKIPLHCFRNYDIPSPEDIPPMNIGFINIDAEDPKGIEELPFCCIPAAYVQAVSQALDHHFEKIPLATEDIWDALKEKQTELPS